MKADKAVLYTHVEFLTSIRPYRNYRNLQSLQKVCDYIKKEFSAMGIIPEEQSWLADGKEYKNIIASYNRDKQKRLIIGAHYDVAGDQPGADDNASAVAGLLETARMVFQSKPVIDYRIDFVAYCLEEPPFFATDLMGSYIHARSLFNEGADVIGIICYEMIGYFTDGPQQYPSPELKKMYPAKGNFIVVVGINKFDKFNRKFHQLMSSESLVDVQVISFPSDGNGGLAGLSDQSSYWRFNYPALMINDTAFIRNPNYHLQTDTIDTINFEKMTEVVNSAYRAIIRMN